MNEKIKQNSHDHYSSFCNNSERRGFTLIELVVSATLIMTMMSVVVPLAVRGNRLWQDSRYYRLALEELNNQWDQLSSLDTAERATAITKLAPSPQIGAVLPNPVLTAESISDQDGSRIILSLTWDRAGKNVPVKLVGWVNPLPTLTGSLREGINL